MFTTQLPMNNSYSYVNYLVSNYYYCAFSKYSHTNRIYAMVYVNYSQTPLFEREVQNTIIAHAQSIHIRIEFTRRKTFKRTDSHGVY